MASGLARCVEEVVSDLARLGGWWWAGGVVLADLVYAFGLGGRLVWVVGLG